MLYLLRQSGRGLQGRGAGGGGAGGWGRQPAAAAEEGSPATLEGAAEGSPPNPLSLRLFLLPLSVLLLLLPLRLRCLLAPEPLWSLELLSPLGRPSSRKGGSLLALGEGRWLLLSLLQQYQ